MRYLARHIGLWLLSFGTHGIVTMEIRVENEDGGSQPIGSVDILKYIADNLDAEPKRG